jgi:hypothetical protein
MSSDNNPGGQQKDSAYLPEIIKKVGNSLNLGKGGKPLWLVSANPLVELVRNTNEMPTVEEVEGKVLSPSRKQSSRKPLETHKGAAFKNAFSEDYPEMNKDNFDTRKEIL